MPEQKNTILKHFFKGNLIGKSSAPKLRKSNVKSLSNRFDDETAAAATAAHTRYLLSPAAATLHGKTQGFVLWLPPQKQAPCNSHAAITICFAASRL
jgi:hypothetical protein